jgi:anti-sigma regulatory factor (Ser/Thr protein kinase)
VAKNKKLPLQLLYKQQEKRKVKIMEKVKGVKTSVSIKDQGTVNYKQVESVPNPGGPKPYGAGKSRGGGAALRGTKFSGVS